ncbi:MAG: hypothetical protein H6519_04255 [Microthrixaceae bacterium]|nr:hypothetical protein [Microthrixaceae bacterium]
MVLIAVAIWWKRPVQIALSVAAGAVAALLVASLQSWLDRSTPLVVERELSLRVG